MLDYIDKSSLTDVERKHWRSVGYFFRAYNYSNLLNMYGAVPYLDHALTDADAQLYIPRTPRDSVAMNILNDLQYAETNIGNGDGNNTINNKSVVIKSNPINGILLVDPNTGIVTYTPSIGYSGTDNFTYTIKDITGSESNIGTVEIETVPIFYRENYRDRNF